MKRVILLAYVLVMIGVCGLSQSAMASCWIYDGAEAPSDTTNNLSNGIGLHNSSSQSCIKNGESYDIIWPVSAYLLADSADDIVYESIEYPTVYVPSKLPIRNGARELTIGNPDGMKIIVDGRELDCMFQLDNDSSSKKVTFQHMIVYAKSRDTIFCGSSPDQDVSNRYIEGPGFEVYEVYDADGDGHLSDDIGGDDCDDTNDDINPDASETPDNKVDENCDGYYAFDSDNDNYSIYYTNGNKSGSQVEPSGVKVDCNDTVATIHPDAQETANDTDDDCDDIVDETTSYYDDDGDGYCEAYTRNIAGSDHRCLTANASDVNGDGVQDTKDADCNDANGGIKPLASESQDNIDNNCNGLTDEGFAGEDADGDGYYAGATVDPDCDDTNPDIHPGAQEIPANGINEDCDAETDEGYSVDNDGDGYAPVSSGGGDCNDANAAINPGAAEVKNNTTDEDCDGLYAYDRDGDTYLACYSNSDGTGLSASNACDDQLRGNDCNDADTTIHIGAYDTPDDGIDQDCSGADAVSTDDNDGDGYQASIDCDDVDPSIHPGAAEVANNGVDEDCDGTTAADADHDNHNVYTNTTTTAVDTTQDCNDTNPDVYLGHAEVAANSIDDNCDGQVDEVGGAPNPDDQDNDGFETSVDCNDSDPAINPVAVEIAGNTVDENCDGLYAYDRDADTYEVYYAASDGTGAVTAQPEDDCDDTTSAVNPGVTEVPGNNIDDNCNDQVDEVGVDADSDGYPSTVDCNDGNAAIHPGAIEDISNGVDDDCDGAIDETPGGGGGGGDDDSIDEDNDGYTRNLDCDDNDISVNPGAIEGDTADGKDNDCNGIVDDITPCDPTRVDVDCDDDGILNGEDNCDLTPNLPTSDTNADGVVDTNDAQADYDQDTLGDACDDNPCGIPESIDEETRDELQRECAAARGTVIPQPSVSSGGTGDGGRSGACALASNADVPFRPEDFFVLALGIIGLVMSRRLAGQKN